jgi:serine/threonine protein kinase
MGDVYQAMDVKLGRDVAIKFLPEAFSRDAERVARFQREARVLAALNHPSIAGIYGVEEVDDRHFLVMEFVAGETIADRIRHGAIPLEEALAIAKQIAEALEAAHEKGIVHRDLKPANIKITPEGKVKVLDFGLAKAFEPEAASVTLSNSPTMSVAATQHGVILGTAAYMSPEQARGKPVDKRADIWAFGVVLHEMLTGRTVFAGEDVTSTLAKVIETEPSWVGISEKPLRLLKKCLEKNPRKRLRDIGDAWELLSSENAADLRPAISRSGSFRRNVWPAAAMALALLLGALAYIHFRERSPAPEMVRFEFNAPIALSTGETGSAPVVSPDGKRIAFAAVGPNGRDQLWVHTFATNESKPLAGSEGVSSRPFWSSDSRFMAYATDDGRLRKIDPAGGSPQTVTDLPGAFRGGAWTRDQNGGGVIVYSVRRGATRESGLMRVSEAGGATTPLTVPERLRPEANPSAPQFLPDGRHFLYTRSVPNGEILGLYIGSLDAKPELQNAEPLLPGVAGVGYAPAPDGKHGYLLFIRGTSLMAQPFDAAKFQLSGEAVVIAEGLAIGINGGARVSVSTTGILTFRRLIEGVGGTNVGQRQLTWFDREGKVLGTVGEPGATNFLALSPDGTRVAFDRRSRSSRPNIWIYEFQRGISTQLTFNSAADGYGYPVWSGDSSRLVFSSNRDGALSLYTKAANGAGKDELLFKSGASSVLAQDWSRDGRFLLYSLEGDGGQAVDLWKLSLAPKADGKIELKGKEEVYLNSSAVAVQGRFSPDGGFVAYSSGEGGRMSDIYVQHFPDPKGKWKISEGGGSQPRWRGDGKEIYYISADAKMMAVEVSTTPEFVKIDTRKALFPVPISGGLTGIAVRYDVSADGKKFLVNADIPKTPSPGPPPSEPITVILNWQALLKP